MNLATLKFVVDLAQDELNTSVLPKSRPANAVRVTFQGKHYKVRRYRNEAEAQKQAGFVESLVPLGVFAGFYGQVKEFLVFPYIEPGIHGRYTPLGGQLYAIGQVLGKINSITAGPVDIDRQFQDWLQCISRKGIISKYAMRRAIRAFQEAKPSKLEFCLEHWDIVPWNFVHTSDQTFLIDEKQLWVSVRGTALIKPKFILQECEFNELLAGYSATADVQYFLENQKFLRLLYTVFWLHRYALREYFELPSLKHARFREINNCFISQVCPSLPRRWYERMHLYVNSDCPGSIKSGISRTRLGHFFRLRKQSV